MNRLGVQLLVLAVLIGVNGLLAGTEMALVSLRESQARKLERDDPRRGRALRRLLDNPNRFLSAVQLGITLAGFLASAAAAVTLADRLAAQMDFLGRYASAVAVVIVTAILTFVTLVFGEIAPKRMAMQKAERWSLRAARPLSWFAWITWPAVWLLSATTNLVLTVAGVSPSGRQAPVTEEEFRDLIAGQPAFTAVEKEVIAGALEIGDRTLEQVMRPRSEVFMLPAGVTAHEGLNMLIESGHTRAPVVGPGGLDDLTGVVHMRDLVLAAGVVAEAARPAVVLPQNMRALEGLSRLRQERQQMAVVLSEHLQAEGIVTIEDLLEEIVGEIYDEMDKDFQTVQELPGGVISLPGSFPIHDLPDIGVELPSGPYSSVAGLVLHRLTRLPAREGDTVDMGRWRLTVTGVRGLTIVRVELAPRR
jgi:putative hemolysin